MMPSISQLLIVLAIMLLLFGAKRLRTLGGDLGTAIRGFKKSMSDDETAENSANLKHESAPNSDDTTAKPAKETSQKNT